VAGPHAARRSCLARIAIAFGALVFPSPAAAVPQPSFGPQREIATPITGGTDLDLTRGDLSGDGREDILVLRGRWGSAEDLPISIFVNDGHGGFSDRTGELFEGPIPTAEWPRQALIEDFNGDGRPDIFIGDTGLDQPPFPGHLNYLALSTPGGRLVDARANLPPEVVYFHSAAAGDVDADGDKDLFLGDLGTPIRLLLNDGTGRFTTASGRLPPEAGLYNGSRYTRSALVDVNGNGSLDLVLLAEEHTATSAVLLNDGNGFFTELTGALPPKPFGTDAIGTEIQPVQLNGDDAVDLLLGYTKGNPWYRGQWIQFAVGNGDGTFRDETATRLPQGDTNAEWPYEIEIGDLNRDGSFDFAVDIGAPFCCPGRKTAPPVYLNRGDGSFDLASPTAFAQPPLGQLRLVDANQDGDLDIFGVWQSGIDRVEYFVVQLQNDDDGDGLTNGLDRCPKFAATAPNGCPGATLTRAGSVRVKREGKRGLRVLASVKAWCPPAGIACLGRLAVSAKRMRRHSSRLRVPAGRTLRPSLKLSRRAVGLLRKTRKAKLKLAIVLTGPDGARVRLSRTATIRVAPKRRG
jgi:hypothetical protein